MTTDEMYRATGLGPEWRLIWMGADPCSAVRHLCPQITAPATGSYPEQVHLPYAPTATPGISVAACARCCIGWVRAGVAEAQPAGTRDTLGN